MSGLWDVIAASIRDDTALRVLAGPQPVNVPVTRVMEDAERTAGLLLSTLRGRPPATLGILMANGEPWVRGLLAGARLGAAVVPLGLPVAFAGPDAYIRHLARLIDDARIDAVLVDSSIRRHLRSWITAKLPDVALVDISDPGAGRRLRGGQAADASPYAVIQYTSGSTSAPKGVTLTGDNVVSGLATLADGLGWSAGDVLGMWSPLFHDMGLFCLLAAFSRGSSVCVWRPGDFIRRPLEWLASFAAQQATVLPAPNFGYDVLAAAVREGRPRDLDLSCWRLACNGAEPVQARTLENFQEIMSGYGLRAEASNPVYGMAEATLFITGPSPAARWTSVLVGRERLAPGERVRIHESAQSGESRAVVSCGCAGPGIRIRIAGADGSPAPDAVVGEAQITGPSVTRGYLNVPANLQPFTRDGWLRTGDLGFLLNGELYLVGRLKDMITVHGQNYYPEDVEEVVRSITGEAMQRAVAIPWTDDGPERMVVLWEAASDGVEAPRVSQSIRTRVAAELGLAAVEVVPVPRTTIPHTTSGKVQRKAALRLCREAGLVPAADPGPAKGRQP